MRGLTSKPKQKNKPSSGAGLSMVIDSEVGESDEGIFY